MSTLKHVIKLYAQFLLCLLLACLRNPTAFLSVRILDREQLKIQIPLINAGVLHSAYLSGFDSTVVRGGHQLFSSLPCSPWKRTFHEVGGYQDPSLAQTISLRRKFRV